LDRASLADLEIEPCICLVVALAGGAAALSLQPTHVLQWAQASIWAKAAMGTKILAAGGAVMMPLIFLSPSYGQPALCKFLSREAYKLNSDIVVWEIEIAANQDCVRGVRTGTVFINNLKVVTPPRSGQVTLQGPAFYYRTKPNFQGADSFEIIIAGRMNGIAGTSTVQVLVQIR
jgi:hypothetical protein